MVLFDLSFPCGEQIFKRSLLDAFTNVQSIAFQTSVLNVLLHLMQFLSAVLLTNDSHLKLFLLLEYEILSNSITAWSIKNNGEIDCTISIGE